MKKLIVTTFLVFGIIGFAQTYSVPAASPRQKIEQEFSISKITVDYGRPGVKGRKIFGGLVPYNKVWRAGANSSTKISFGQAMSIGGKTIPAGTYGLFILPTDKEWKVIFNKDFQQWGSDAYNENLNVLDISVPVQKMSDKQEFFEISLDPLNENTLALNMKWEDVKTSVPMQVDKLETINKIVEKVKEAKQIEREATNKK